MTRPARAALLLALLVSVGLPAAGLTAASPAAAAGCTVVGTAGADRLVGTERADVICGLGGADVILGRGGPDELLGGPGDDVISGGDGADDLAGGRGDDDLTGGARPDEIGGGTGTDWCTVAGNDVATSCVHDLAAPIADAGRVGPDRVDVTGDDAQATVRAHVTDDTGAVRVTLGLGDPTGTGGAIGPDAHLVSGTIRDGWWEATLTVPRWSAPGDYEVAASVRDRVGRWGGRAFGDQTLHVVDRNPDLDLPRARVLAPTGDRAYDVRTASQDVTVKVRVIDEVSGVWYVDLCLSRPMDGWYGNLPCERADRVSGDIHDGVWRADVRIPRRATGGDWNVVADTVDLAHRAMSPVQWMGPDVYRYWTGGVESTDPNVQQFPDGQGRFAVVGTTDSTAARIVSATVTPTEVDTLAAPATVRVSVDAVDAAGEGITDVGVSLHAATSDGSEPMFGWLSLELTDGTATDGTWTGSIDIPQGTPPGHYYLQAWAEDATHWRSYVSPGSPYAGEADQQVLEGDTVVTVVE